MNTALLEQSYLDRLPECYRGNDRAIEVTTYSNRSMATHHENPN